MNEDGIYKTYWASVNALSASTHLRGVDEDASRVLLKISRVLCRRLEEVFEMQKSQGPDEIREEIQRYVEEIRGQQSDK